MSKTKKIKQYDKDGNEVAVYDSLQEACDALGGYKISNLSAHLHGRKPKTIHGFTFKLVKQHLPRRFDWTNHWQFIFWSCHQAVKEAFPDYRREAWEYVFGYVVEHLKFYKRRSCTPERHIQHSAQWGWLQWLKHHYAHLNEVMLDDDGWKTVEGVAATSSIDSLLDEMPDDFRTISEGRLEGLGHDEIRESMQLTAEQYEQRLNALHDWLNETWT